MAIEKLPNYSLKLS